MFLLLILSLAFVQSANAAEKGKKKASNITNATSSNSSKKMWKPIPFVLESDRLPANYKGNDPIKFLSLFNAKIVGLKKDELETSDEYKTRMLGKEAVLAPLNFTDQYAFAFDNVSFKYDAEAFAYEVEGTSMCLLNYPYQLGMDTVVTCRMSNLEIESDSYSGGNAYGATAQIKRIRGSDFAVAIPRSNSYLDSMLISYRPSGFKYTDKLPIDIEKARNLKNMKIGVLFVGKIYDAKLIEVEPNTTKPTLDNPVDIMISGQAIPFELNKIFYYVVATGEILGEKSF